ncbi:MAG: CBS domain-containing protein [Micrococcales bacterium]|nr:CBS domain-containing protein [Micrococcales bacterium]
MKISDVLRSKGAGVISIKPDDTVVSLLALLAEHRIGACVVSVDGKSVDGIVSERDVVSRLHSDGTAMLTGPVSAIMTSNVTTGTMDEEVKVLAGKMTDQRIRHVPVIDADGALLAIVSIGDVVKSRLAELKSERDHLRDYISR